MKMGILAKISGFWLPKLMRVKSHQEEELFVTKQVALCQGDSGHWTAFGDAVITWGQGCY